MRISMKLSVSLSESASYRTILGLPAEFTWIYDCEYGYEFVNPISRNW